jgi:hypothetical protein
MIARGQSEDPIADAERRHFDADRLHLAGEIHAENRLPDRR